MRNALELRRSTGAVFLNYAHAFYSVWYIGLLYKMRRFGINPNLVDLICSYLSGRTFQTKRFEDLQSWYSAGVIVGPRNIRFVYFR